MPNYEVFFSPTAERQLERLEDYIAKEASPEIAARYVDAIIAFCLDLSIFPHRSNRRNDIRDGIRITNYKKRAVIAFSVEDSMVNILGIFYGGRNYARLLVEDEI